MPVGPDLLASCEDSVYCRYDAGTNDSTTPLTFFLPLYRTVPVPTHRPLHVETVQFLEGHISGASPTAQQGPDAIQVEEGLFRRQWAVPGGVCGVALPELRRRGKTAGFHSFVPFNLFPTSSASSLADAYQGPDLRQLKELFQPGGVVATFPLAHGLTIGMVYFDSLAWPRE
ncbi:predicted protein [Pyrenophora tritici-repentis Pt-1C-BFP]|uniref:Uncharacterized protein n=1 Tax=Pyrenophora tritici-repentis (strain Pt-1C-BFP) TaxID=426418 RepID=B2VZG7_PYRTR|nr:uncharacterized protein PTRG_02807 [Pyrenophora tritici-repentis Pt-1C-BFP]EDU45330.1 predicted protein [Pyrenophora tritici-repentis Pt-1C-BFP]